PIVRRAPVWMTAAGEVGGPLRLAVRDADGHEATADWPGPIEVAKKHPLTAEALRDQLGRLGDTPFELADVEVRLPANAMLPRSMCTARRRRACTALLARRTAAIRVEVIEPDALTRLRADLHPSSFILHPSQLTVLVRTLDQFDAVLPLRPAMVYCDFE